MRISTQDSSMAFLEVGEVPGPIQLPPIPEPIPKTDSSISLESVNPPEFITLELYVIPTDQTESFQIDRILFDLSTPSSDITVSGYLPIMVRGRRLFATKQQVFFDTRHF